MKTAPIQRVLRYTLRQRERPAEPVTVALCVLVLAAGTAWSIADNNRQIKVAGVMIIVIVLSSLILSARGMWIVATSIVLCLAIVFRVHGLNPGQLSLSGFAMIGCALAVAIAQARRRDRLGLRQMSAEKVIGLIRDRLLVQAQLPAVPTGWSVQIQQRPADGAAIAGDFVSNRLVCSDGEQTLHLAVIDVSGNGIAAGPRALLLSGAVGGLLGAVAPENFLAAANDYLSRQQWSLGFASAIYVTMNLTTGAYQVRVAGHPPAMHFRPLQSPPWRTSPATGTVLGVLATLTTVADSDTLQPGEALFLYTDGIVEDRTRDIDAGTLRFTEAVQSIAARNAWDGAAEELIERVPTQHGDDRTVVMIRRSGQLDGVRPAAASTAQPAPAEAGGSAAGRSAGLPAGQSRRP